LSVALFIRHFLEEKGGQLWAVGAADFGGIGNVLNDRSQFAGQIFIEMGNECLLVNGIGYRGSVGHTGFSFRLLNAEIR
jgi:hypothetical protein